MKVYVKCKRNAGSGLILGHSENFTKAIYGFTETEFNTGRYNENAGFLLFNLSGRNTTSKPECKENGRRVFK